MQNEVIKLIKQTMTVNAVGNGKRYNIVNVFINRFRQPELLTARY